MLVMLDKQGTIEWDIAYMNWDICISKKRGLKVDKTKKGKGTKIMLAVDGNGIPLTLLTEATNISEFKLALQTIDQISVSTRPLHPHTRPEILVADKGYDAEWLRKAISKRNIKPKIPKRRKPEETEEPTHNTGIKPYYKTRWIIERTNA